MTLPTIHRPQPLSTERDLATLSVYAERLEQLHRGKTFHAKQQAVIRAIFQQGYKRIFIRKGRKAGGTQTIMYPVVRLAGCFDNQACYIIGPQYNLQKEIVWANNRLRNFIPKEWQPSFKEYEARVRFPNGSFIKIQGADNYKSMVGIEGDVFIFDELKDHDVRAYKNCYPNVASRDALWIVLGAPPKNKSNFYFKLEEQIKDDPDWFFIHWPTWDNAEFLPGGTSWIQNEKDSYYRRGDWDEWETEWEARYIFGGKRTVLSSFRTEGPGSHVVPYDVIEARITQDKRKLKWFQVYDPGFATCFAIIFAAINPYTSEIYILDAIHETDRNKLSVNEIWPRVREKEESLYPGGVWRRVYDSAAPGFPNEVRSRWGRGFSFQPTFKEKDDEDKYFRVLNGAMATGHFWIADRCTGAIDEMENYLTTELGEYPDHDNHALDCLRYLLKAANYSFNQKQNDVVLIPDIARVYRPEDDIIKHKRQDDWASALDIPTVDFDFNDSSGFGWH